MGIRAIGRHLGLNVNVVRHYLRQERCPDWSPGRQLPTQLDQHAAFIDAWVARGGRNAADLYRALQAQGSQVGYDAVRRFLRRKVGSTGRPGPRTGATVPPTPPPPSARQLSFAFVRHPEDRSPEAQGWLARLHEGAAVLKEGLALVAELAAMIRKDKPTPLADWLAKAEASTVGEMRSLAESLRQDEAAVTAGLTTRWSNGPVEGEVNRLKLLKRQSYGRAGFALLRARVRFAS
jgi:hypothetical protein